MNKDFVMSYYGSEPNSAFPAGFHIVGKTKPCTDHQPCCSHRGIKRFETMCKYVVAIGLGRTCTCHEGTP